MGFCRGEFLGRRDYDWRQITFLGFRTIGCEWNSQGFWLDTGFRVAGTGFRVASTGFRVAGEGFRVAGTGFRVAGEGGVQSNQKLLKSTILTANFLKSNIPQSDGRNYAATDALLYYQRLS
jgi:hypothetical protein